MTVRELLAGDTDVAVVNQSPADQSEIVARHVVSNSTPVFASPQYLEAHGVPRTPEDLSRHVGLLQVMPNNAPTMILYRDGVASNIIHWQNIYLSHDQFLIRNMVLNHQALRGISIWDMWWKSSDRGRSFRFFPAGSGRTGICTFWRDETVICRIL